MVNSHPSSETLDRFKNLLAANFLLIQSILNCLGDLLEWSSGTHRDWKEEEMLEEPTPLTMDLLSQLFPSE